MDVVTGSFDYNTVLRRVVKELSASGLQVIDYSSGWRNRAPVAARRAVLTGVSQLSAQINEQVAKDLKTAKYEVSWHSGHRPSHWWGGRVYTYQELQSVCGLGEGDGPVSYTHLDVYKRQECGITMKREDAQHREWM